MAHLSTSPPLSLLASSSSPEPGDDDDAPLPFPAALPRSDFLAPDFQPAAYLSALPRRHQTLEDLRADLRDRGSAIGAELLDLVNSNYTAFLSLGDDLRGGADKVEDVKVALLGFRRAVDEIKAKVAQGRQEALLLNAQLRHVRSDIAHGRSLIELSDRVTALRERLAMDPRPADDDGLLGPESSGHDDDDDDDADKHVEGLVGSPPARLLQSARDYNQAAALAASLDPQHPLVIESRERLTACRDTLLLDLANATKEARAAGHRGQGRVVRYLHVYRLLDARQDAVKALRKA